jgi:hypothetical protein
VTEVSSVRSLVCVLRLDSFSVKDTESTMSFVWQMAVGGWAYEFDRIKGVDGVVMR